MSVYRVACPPEEKPEKTLACRLGFHRWVWTVGVRLGFGWSMHALYCSRPGCGAEKLQESVVL